MRIGGFGDGWTPKTSIFPQISPKSLQNIARKWAFLVNALKKCFFHPNLPQFPPIFAQNLRILDGENVEFWRFPPKKKKRYFFIILKNDIFAPFRPIFAQFPLHWSASVKKSEVSLLGFVAPKLAFFRPISSLCLQPKGRSVGKKEVRILGGKPPKTPFSQKGSRRAFFWGEKRPFWGAHSSLDFGPEKRGGKMAILGGFAPILGVAGEKKWAFWENGPKMWGGFGGIWGKLGGKWGKSGGKRRKWLKMGETTQKWGKLGQKVAELGEVD